VESTYRYGSTQEGTREAHHGVEFGNPGGTPVLAVADGMVIIAGTDSKTSFGPINGFYGSLVILEHNISGLVRPIFTLYGHLSSIDVASGDTVTKGQQIGRVGKTGTAAGSHLHFEVRVGENSYSSTVNPEIWLEPTLSSQTNQKHGTLILQLRFKDGTIYSTPILIQNFDELNASIHKFIDAESYAWGTPVDAYWQENLIVGDIEPGIYRISFLRSGKSYQKYIEIEPAKITLVEFQIDY
jgi:murein DD-endopeptidase MepM/ murein hydrolase activator NlpD